MFLILEMRDIHAFLYPVSMHGSAVLAPGLWSLGVECEAAPAATPAIRMTTRRVCPPARAPDGS